MNSQVSLFLRGRPSPLCMKTASLSIFSHPKDQCVASASLELGDLDFIPPPPSHPLGHHRALS